MFWKFYSEQANELRIPEGFELDLSAFGKDADGEPLTEYRQQIAFGGSVKLVLEPGAKIRFPSLDNIDAKYPVLYFNDDSQLIFEGSQDGAKGRFIDADEIADTKCKIYGCGQIWLNKDAQMKVMGDARVAVISDDATPITDLIVSIQRQGAFYIGDTTEAGGAFEVGNMESVDDSKVCFSLTLNGPKATFHIDREGFFGLGVGIVNKDGNMNGGAEIDDNPTEEEGVFTWSPDEYKAWQVNALFNVHKVIITVTKGIFDHSNIFNGSDRQSSLMAFGPLAADPDTEDAGSYTFVIADPNLSRVLGGGNIMHLAEESTGVFVNAWNIADSAARDTYDMYSILASTAVALQQDPDSFTDSTLTVLDGGGHQFVGTQDDLFTYISYPLYSTLRQKFVCLGATQFQNYIGYVGAATTYDTGNEIFRTEDFNVISDRSADEGLVIGVLGATGNASPESYTVVIRKQRSQIGGLLPSEFKI